MPRQRGRPTVDGVGSCSETGARRDEGDVLNGARNLARERDTAKVRILITSLPLLAVTVIACALAVAHTGGGSEEDLTIASSRVPDWFLPIADAYDRNPAITPKTDFAVLHFGDPWSTSSSAWRTPSSFRRNPELVGVRR
jgi:hypothetical protein